MSGSRIHRLVGIALLSALGYILMSFFEFPIIPAFSFLKLDFSDLTVLLGGFLYGPLGGIAVAFVRSLAHFAMTGGGVINLVGDVAAFIASVSFMLPVVLAVKPKVSGLRQFGGITAGVLSLTLVMSVLNWLVIMPTYLAVMNFQLGVSTLKYVLIGVVPFNLIKGVVVSLLFVALAHALMPILAKQRAQQELRHN